MLLVSSRICRLMHAIEGGTFTYIGLLRSSICYMRPDSHTYFLFCFLEVSLFPSICFFVLYGEYGARFPLLDGVVYLVTTGWSFDIITRRLV